MAELKETNLITNTGLKAYYKFSSGSLNTDSSGNGKTLSVVGTPYLVAGKFHDGIYQDVSNYSYLNADVLGLIASNWSISAWVKALSNSQVSTICYVGNGGSNGFGFLQNNNVNFTAGNYINILFGGVAYKNTGIQFPDTTKYHHLVITRDSTTVTLYLNGVSVYSSGTGTPINPTGNINIANNASYNIDDVAFFNIVLTSDQVKQLYVDSPLKDNLSVLNVT